MALLAAALVPWCADAQRFGEGGLPPGIPDVATLPHGAPAAVDAPRDSLAVLRRWTIREGLPQQSVTQLAFDEAGFLWGATFGGLVRVDGERIESFGLGQLPFLTGNAVTALTAARAGGLWIGAGDGLVAQVRDGRAVRVLPRIGDSPATVSALAEGTDGALWAWQGRDIHRWRDGRWTRVVAGTNVASQATPLLPLGGDTLLYGEGRGVMRVAGGRIAPLAPGDPLLARMVRGALHRDRGGRLWVGQKDGLVWWRPGTAARRVAGFRSDVTAITEDGGGVLWVATADTIWRVVPRDDDGEPAVTIASVATGQHHALAVTRDGVLVVGTIGDGLLELLPRMMRLVRVRAGREASNVHGDAAGGLLVSYGCDGLVRLDPTLQRAAPVALPRGMQCVRSLARDDRGRLWVASFGGLARDEGAGRWTRIALPDDGAYTLPTRPLLALGGDSLLLGSEGGGILLVHAADSVARPWPAWRGGDRGAISALVRGPDGAVWVGQVGHVTRVGREGAMRLDTAAGVPPGAVRAILPQRDGSVWVGTYGGGLALLDPGRGAPRRVPLTDGTVIAVVPDTADNLWVLQNQGLAVLRRGGIARWRRDSTAAPPVLTLGDLPDMAEGNNGSPASWPLPGGRLAFVTVDGLLVADAARLPPPAGAPPVRILEVRGAHGLLAGGDTLHAVRGDRTLGVRVSAPAFRSPGALRFRYRLEGRDTAWIDMGTNRQFLLTDLAPGRYVLQVALLGLDGATSRAVPVVLEIPPYWHETLPVRLAIGALVLATIGVLVRLRVGVVEARTAALQAQIEARRQAALETDRHRRELAQVGRVAMVGEMTAALMHELGQPLSAIVNNAETARRLLRRPGTPAAVVDETLDDVVGQGVRASQVVTSLRRFLRSGEGVRETLEVSELVAEVAALVRSEFTEQQVALATRIEPGTPPVVGERILLQQVLVNLLANAVDAARGRPEAAVLLRARAAGHGGVRLTVADNGPGVAPRLRATAFDPFVSGKDEGMGMGLAIARRIVEAHGGTIAIGALPGAGAVVSIRLPGPAEVLR